MSHQLLNLQSKQPWQEQTVRGRILSVMELVRSKLEQEILSPFLSGNGHNPGTKKDKEVREGK